jgi:hypothetical protein
MILECWGLLKSFLKAASDKMVQSLQNAITGWLNEFDDFAETPVDCLKPKPEKR